MRTSSLNSTQTTLGASETFTGVGETTPFTHIAIALKTDADGDLYVDFSTDDGENWDSTLSASVTADVPEYHIFQKNNRMYRVRLVNGSDAQTYLRMQTDTGDYQKGTAPNNLTLGLDADSESVRPTDFTDEVRTGRRAGVTGWAQWGYRSGLTTSDGYETVWATTGNFTPLTSAETFDIAYNSTTDGSGSTGAQLLRISYIDANGYQAAAIHTLGSSGSDTTAFTGLGINRVEVSQTGSNQANENDITITATTAGTTQAVVPAGESLTNQAIYFNGANSDAVAKFLWINIIKGPSGGNPTVNIRIRVWNRNIATYFNIFQAIINTQTDQTIQIVDPVGFSLSPSDVLIVEADTDTNNAEVRARFSLLEYDRD